MSRRPLRVGVPDSLFALRPDTGHGRMWHRVLERLDRDLRLVRVHTGGRRRLWGRPRIDVALVDGHGGPVDLDVPQVVQLHEAPWDEPETMATLDPAFVELLVAPSRAAAERAAMIVCPSASSGVQIERVYGVDHDRVVVAHHGVDHDVFHPGAPGGHALLAAHAGREVPTVLFVGSFHPRKNLQLVREACRRLADQSLDHQLVVVGGPVHDRSDADALVRAGQAPIPGHPEVLVCIPFGRTDPELAGLMSAATVLCLPSFSEGFGLPVAEAAACATATVVADRGALPEVAGPGGLLVEPAADAVTAGLGEVLSDPVRARELGEMGRSHARAFTWDACAARWAVALRRAADR